MSIFNENLRNASTKNPSSRLIFKAEIIASIKTTHVTKILLLVLSPLCEIYAITLVGNHADAES